MAVLVVIALFVITLIAMGMGALELFWKHQREMASLNQRGSDMRTAALEQKVEELTQLVYQQTIALDGAHTFSSDVREKVGV